MDTQTQFFMYSGFAISILTAIFGVVNRSHIRSKCCGKIYDASIVIDREVDTPTPTIKINSLPLKENGQPPTNALRTVHGKTHKGTKGPREENAGDG